jgi:hypothetical protein
MPTKPSLSEIEKVYRPSVKQCRSVLDQQAVGGYFAQPYSRVCFVTINGISGVMLFKKN